MEITIRKGVKADLSAVLSLIKELADFENARDQVTITLRGPGKGWIWGESLVLVLSCRKR